jgi:hypothetical protein
MTVQKQKFEMFNSIVDSTAKYLQSISPHVFDLISTSQKKGGDKPRHQRSADDKCVAGKRRPVVPPRGGVSTTIPVPSEQSGKSPVCPPTPAR